MPATVYLIPTVLHEGQTNCLPAYILDAVKSCNVLFVENVRTARRYLKYLWKDLVIDEYEWHNIKEISDTTVSTFKQKISEHKIIGIMSESGCPGVADPGQQLIDIAHKQNIPVKPLVGPNSILLALMASGMNGQRFEFLGYLPIDAEEREKAIRQLEAASKQKNCTKIFIETPYRNNQLLTALIKTCQHNTKLCIASQLTAPDEFIKTKTIKEWRNHLPDIHKNPTIFLVWSS
jgi:16S rRNA (cytidine1402-2'-O)-methyltransferase